MRDYVFAIAWIWANKKAMQESSAHLRPNASLSQSSLKLLAVWKLYHQFYSVLKTGTHQCSDKVDYNKDSPQPTKQSFIFCLISPISKDFIIFPWHLVFNFIPFLFVFSTSSVSGTLYFILSLIYVFIDSLPFYFFIYRVTFTLEHQLIHT